MCIIVNVVQQHVMYCIHVCMYVHSCLMYIYTCVYVFVFAYYLGARLFDIDRTRLWIFRLNCFVAFLRLRSYMRLIMHSSIRFPCASLFHWRYTIWLRYTLILVKTIGSIELIKSNLKNSKVFDKIYVCYVINL